MTPGELRSRLESSAFAFRGYNTTNLGRTPELLDHHAYGSTVRECLESASAVCANVIGKPTDLVSRVESREETSLEIYSEAIALVMAVEQAQIRILAEQFGIEMKQAQFALGYSLGEITAVRAVFNYAMASRQNIRLNPDWGGGCLWDPSQLSAMTPTWFTNARADAKLGKGKVLRRRSPTTVQPGPSRARSARHASPGSRGVPVGIGRQVRAASSASADSSITAG